MSHDQSLGNRLITKVPEISILFWVIKILTTANGESISDYLVSVIDPVIAVLGGGVILCFALWLQFKSPRYTPWIYWFTVVMVAVTGTMAADVVHIVLGVPYLASSIFFAVALAIIFLLWWKIEKTLSIHSITTYRREAFYWATVMTTFALGTATGDMTAYTFKLGYLDSGLLFGILIALITLTHFITKVFLKLESRTAVLTFWLAYILTRPLGASFADWMGKTQTVGGLGWGDDIVSIGLTLLILCAVWYITYTSSAKRTR